MKYQTPQNHYVVLKGGDVEAIVTDNAAVDNRWLQDHRAGYSGIASLTHKRQPKNLLCPVMQASTSSTSMMAWQLISKRSSSRRKSAMEMRVINDSTVELYQPATPNFQLESCGRYQILPNGVIEYSFECIPRAKTFSQGYIGLFWASYIQQPQDKTIRFQGRKFGAQSPHEWLIGQTPTHGVNASHRPSGWKNATAPVAADFPLTLVDHPSPYEHTEAWYYGVSGEMAFVQMFRPQDKIHFAQSPSGAATATRPGTFSGSCQTIKSAFPMDLSCESPISPKHPPKSWRQQFQNCGPNAQRSHKKQQLPWCLQ